MIISPRTRRRPRLPAVATVAFVSAFALTACGASATESTTATATDQPTEVSSAADRLALTYDGGVMVLDAGTGEVLTDAALEGFNRISPAGDGRHVLVSTSGGFRVLDSGAWSEGHDGHFHHFTSAPALRDLTFPAEQPGHVVRHADQTVLFDDGTGAVGVFDPSTLGDGALPETQNYTTPEAHHGVAVVLENGQMITTAGNDEARTGVRLLDKAAADGSRKVLASSDECPGVHGEAVAADETVVFGCSDGLLVVKDGKITKVASPDAYGRIGNQAGSEASSVVLGDYKKDEDAELERPNSFTLVDTATEKIRLVDIDYSYSFRSLGRGQLGEALVLGTDGKLHVYDPESGKETSAIDVVGEWTEPVDWQEPRPTLHVDGWIAYVTEPASKQVHTVDLQSGEVTGNLGLPHVPNEVTAP